MKDRVEPLSCGSWVDKFHKVKCGGKIGKGVSTHDKRARHALARRTLPGPRPSLPEEPGCEEHSAESSIPGLGGVSPGGLVMSSRLAGNLVQTSQAPGDRFRSDRARSKDAKGGARQVEDRRLQAEGGGPAVEDQVDPAIQVGQNVLGPGRGKPVRAVGARCCERLAYPFDQASRHRSAEGLVAPPFPGHQ